jgi:hypothetical protein
MMMSKARVTELTFQDEELARLELPGGTLRVTRDIGSGLSRCFWDPNGMVWAIGDRGPNLKLPVAIKCYDLDDRTILLVNDNDLGVEEVPTRFWRVELAKPLERA